MNFFNEYFELDDDIIFTLKKDDLNSLLECNDFRNKICSYYAALEFKSSFKRLGDAFPSLKLPKTLDTSRILDSKVMISLNRCFEYYLKECEKLLFHRLQYSIQEREELQEIIIVDVDTAVVIVDFSDEKNHDFGLHIKGKDIFEVFDKIYAFMNNLDEGLKLIKEAKNEEEIIFEDISYVVTKKLKSKINRKNHLNLVED